MNYTLDLIHQRQPMLLINVAVYCKRILIANILETTTARKPKIFAIVIGAKIFF